MWKKINNNNQWKKQDTLLPSEASNYSIAIGNLLRSTEGLPTKQYYRNEESIKLSIE